MSLDRFCMYYVDGVGAVQMYNVCIPPCYAVQNVYLFIIVLFMYFFSKQRR